MDGFHLWRLCREYHILASYTSNAGRLLTYLRLILLVFLGRSIYGGKLRYAGIPQDEWNTRQLRQERETSIEREVRVAEEDIEEYYRQRQATREDFDRMVRETARLEEEYGQLGRELREKTRWIPSSKARLVPDCLNPSYSIDREDRSSEELHNEPLRKFPRGRFSQSAVELNKHRKRVRELVDEEAEWKRVCLQWPAYGSADYQEPQFQGLGTVRMDMAYATENMFSADDGFIAEDYMIAENAIAEQEAFAMGERFASEDTFATEITFDERVDDDRTKDESNGAGAMSVKDNDVNKAPRKARVGRPPKQKSQQLTPAQAVKSHSTPEETPTAPAQPAKRCRGRPRKNPTSNVATAAGPSSTAIKKNEASKTSSVKKGKQRADGPESSRSATARGPATSTSSQAQSRRLEEQQQRNEAKAAHEREAKAQAERAARVRSWHPARNLRGGPSRTVPRLQRPRLQGSPPLEHREEHDVEESQTPASAPIPPEHSEARDGEEARTPSDASEPQTPPPFDAANPLLYTVSSPAKVAQDPTEDVVFEEERQDEGASQLQMLPRTSLLPRIVHAESESYEAP